MSAIYLHEMPIPLFLSQTAPFMGNLWAYSSLQCYVNAKLNILNPYYFTGTIKQHGWVFVCLDLQACLGFR